MEECWVSHDGVVGIEDFNAFFRVYFDEEQMFDYQEFRTNNNGMNMVFDYPSKDEQHDTNYAISLEISKDIVRRATIKVELVGEWNTFVVNRQLTQHHRIRLRWSKDRMLLLFVSPPFLEVPKKRRLSWEDRKENAEEFNLPFKKKRRMKDPQNKPPSGWSPITLTHCINGVEGRSIYHHGRELMDVWDCMCTNLLLRLKLENTSRPTSSDCTLMHAYGRFGICTSMVQEHPCEIGVEDLSSHDKDVLCFDPLKNETADRDLCENSLMTLRDLVSFVMLNLNTRSPAQIQTTLTNLLLRSTAMDSKLYGQSLFGRRQHKFFDGGFNVQERQHEITVEVLSSLDLDVWFCDLSREDEAADINCSKSSFMTLRDLLKRLMLTQYSQTSAQTKTALQRSTTTVTILPNMASSINTGPNLPPIKCRKFAALLASRWPRRRLIYSAEVIFIACKEKWESKSSRTGATRQRDWDAARGHIGDTRYEDEPDSWTIQCDDGAKKMTACYILESWQHTRCGAVKDTEAVSALFVPECSENRD